MSDVKYIYHRLRAAYGPQGWWPVTAKGAKRPRYSGGPRNEKQQLEVTIGAVLTQNTSWKNVERALAALHENELIDIDALLGISERRLAELIKPSGYYNQKAKKLKQLAVFLREHSFAQLAKLPLAALRETLLGVHGVGPETADSIILYALRRPIFVIDAYTRRIFGRLGVAAAEGRYEELQELFHARLRRNERTYNEFHALLVEHGKRVCAKKPRCGECVLRHACPAGAVLTAEAVEN